MNRVGFGCAFLAAVAITAPAAADVTVRQKTSGKMAMGGPMGGEGVQYIKGARMRNDEAITGEGTSTIVDLTTQQMIVLNPKRRQADVYDMTTLGTELAKISASDVQARITPTTETRQLAGATCTVHNMSVAVPTDMGGEKIQLMISGPVCLSKNAPGQADFAAFYKAGAEKGMFFGDPRTAKAQPGHARALAALHREMANLGVPLAQEINISFEGTGPMAGMMSKVGRSTITTEVLSVSTEAIPDSTFEIPAGYKVNKR